MWVCKCKCGKYVTRKKNTLEKGTAKKCDYCVELEKIRNYKGK